MIYSGRCSSPLIIRGRCPSLQLLLSLGLTSRHLRNPCARGIVCFDRRSRRTWSRQRGRSIGWPRSPVRRYPVRIERSPWRLHRGLGRGQFDRISLDRGPDGWFPNRCSGQPDEIPTGEGGPPRGNPGSQRARWREGRSGTASPRTRFPTERQVAVLPAEYPCPLLVLPGSDDPSARSRAAPPGVELDLRGCNPLLESPVPRRLRHAGHRERTRVPRRFGVQFPGAGPGEDRVSHGPGPRTLVRAGNAGRGPYAALPARRGIRILRKRTPEPDRAGRLNGSSQDVRPGLPADPRVPLPGAVGGRAGRLPVAVRLRDRPGAAGRRGRFRRGEPGAGPRGFAAGFSGSPPVPGHLPVALDGRREFGGEHDREREVRLGGAEDGDEVGAMALPRSGPPQSLDLTDPRRSGGIITDLRPGGRRGDPL